MGFFLFSLAGQVQSGCERNQGIEGRIVFESGNQMPGPGVDREPAKGVRRELVIYPLLKRTDLEETQPGFYKVPDREPVKIVTSDTSGHFRAHLPPGDYSLLVREKEQLYANRSDGQGHVFPVAVQAGEMTAVEFKITYEAAY